MQRIEVLSFLGLLVFVAACSAMQTCSDVSGYKWTKHGCRVDTHRSLIFLFDDRAYFDDTDPAYLSKLVCKCMSVAKSRGHSWFAIENLGLCFSKTGTMESHLADFPADPENNCYGELLVKSNMTHEGQECVGGAWRAFFYKIEPLVANDATPPLDEPPLENPLNEEPLICSNKADVAVYVDVSGSIGEAQLDKVKAYLDMFFGRFNYAAGNTRFAVVEYDINPRLKISFQDSSSLRLDEIRQIVGSQLHFTGNSTRTDIALHHLQNMCKTQKRAGVPQTAIMLTDGRSWINGTIFSTAVQKLQADGVRVIAIAVGSNEDLNLDNLYTMCQRFPSQPAAEIAENIIKLETHDNLISTSLSTLNKLVAQACVL